MKIFLNIFAVLLILAGSFMTGQIRCAIYGSVAVVECYTS